MKRLLLLSLLCLPSFALTTVQETLYVYDGSVFTGKILVVAPPLTTQSGHYVPRWQKEYTITDGSVSIDLEPTDTASPANSRYTVYFTPDSGKAGVEYWSVPTSGSPVTIASVRIATNNAVSAAVTLAQISTSGFSKGDTLAFGTSWGRLAVGTNGQVLTADSAQTLGVKWATPSNSGGTWGSITGTLSNQTDLASALAAKADLSHTHAASDVTSGVFSTARLGTGTADSTTYLRGDGTWQTVTGGVSSVFGRSGAVTAQSGDYTAAQVTGAVDQGGNYTNPAWIASLAWGKITGAPTFADTAGSYANPSWITSLAGSKITGNISGNAGTATALAANGANCSAGQVAAGVDASGAAEGCITAATTSGTLTNGDVAVFNSSGQIIDGGTTPGIPPYPTANLIGRYKLWRTNLLACSDAFFTCASNPASVTTNNVTLAANTGVTDPFGTTTAQKMTVTTTSVNHNANFNVTWATNSQARTLSWYCKNDSGAQWMYVMYTNTGGSNNYVYYDCVNGVTGSVASGAIAGISAVSGATGWYRAYLTFASSASSGDMYTSTTNMYFGLSPSNGGASSSMTSGIAMDFAGMQFTDGELATYESTGTTTTQFYTVTDLSGNGNNLTMTGTSTNKPVWLSDRMYFNGASRLEAASAALAQATNAYVVIGDIGPQVQPRCYWIGSDSTYPNMDVCNSYGFNNTGSVQPVTNPGTKFRGSLQPGTNVVVWTANESYDQVWINGVQSDIVPGAGNVPTGGLANRTGYGKLQIGAMTAGSNAIQFIGYLREVLLYSSPLNSSDIQTIYNTAKLETKGTDFSGKKKMPYLNAYFYNYGVQQYIRSQVTWWGDSIMEGVGTTPVQPYTITNFQKASTMATRKGSYAAVSDMDFFANNSASSTVLTIFGCKAFLTPFSAQNMNSGAYAPDYGYLHFEGSSTSALNSVYTPVISGNNCTVTVSGLPDGTQSGTFRVYQKVVNNFGIQGDNARDMIYRMPAMANYYQDSGAQNAAVIWIGVNSMGSVSSGTFQSPADAYQDLLRAVQTAKQYGAKYVFVATILRSNFGFNSTACTSLDDCKNQYNRLIEQGQDKYGYIAIPIADNRVSADSANLATGTACGGSACSSDGTHPTSSGYRYAEAPYFAAVMEQWLNPDPPVSITADYTVKQYDTAIYCDATSGAVNITTPVFPNNPLTVINIGSANNCTITPQTWPSSNGPTYTAKINGATSLAVTPGQMIRFRSRVPKWSTADPQLFTY